MCVTLAFFSLFEAGPAPLASHPHCLTVCDVCFVFLLINPPRDLVCQNLYSSVYERRSWKERGRRHTCVMSSTLWPLAGNAHGACLGGALNTPSNDLLPGLSELSCQDACVADSFCHATGFSIPVGWEKECRLFKSPVVRTLPMSGVSCRLKPGSSSSYIGPSSMSLSFGPGLAQAPGRNSFF